jgi:CubicO group peptidase (beta-lactamase class C family)
MRLYFLFAFLFCCNLVAAQEFDKAKLDSFLVSLEQNKKAMGSLSIFKDGKEVYNNSIGYKDSAQSVKSNSKSLYRIGSISKTYTATLILMLKEKGKLALSDKLSNWFPEIKNAEQITIEHLLRHRSGLFNFTNELNFVQWMTQPIKREDLLQKIIQYTPNFKPGEKFEYSNTNYFLLALITEKVSGKTYHQLLNDFICKPLKLKRTFDLPDSKFISDQTISFKKYADWVPDTKTHLSITLGAGSLVANAEEVNIFLNALFTYKLISKASVDEMSTLVDGYGYGLFRAPFYDRSALGHNGGIDGFRSAGYYFSDDRVNVTYLANAVDYPFNDVMIGVLSIYFGRKYEIPKFENKSSLHSPDELKKLEGIYSSKQLPFEIIISSQSNVLLFKPVHQTEVKLTEKEKFIFEYKAANLQVEFDANAQKFIMKQGFGIYEFVKQNP